MALPGYIMHEVIRANNMECVETTDLEKHLPELDILYMTRVQRERFADLSVYERLKDSYILTVEKMALAKPDMIVLHPLPRVNEISVKIDEDPRACYFKQVKNAKYIRMALILTLLRAAEAAGEPKPEPMPAKRACARKQVVNLLKCENPRCITTTEQELPHIFKLTDKQTHTYRCIWCEAQADK